MGGRVVLVVLVVGLNTHSVIHTFSLFPESQRNPRAVYVCVCVTFTVMCWSVGGAQADQRGVRATHTCTHTGTHTGTHAIQS